ncbi:MAG: prepilin-type N-terminal cleavage/methylation domain-containing protein [Planctomycetes bacterium]|nr:prepilin-type N-terminal cleavage/methylation domain-containing protein [Planctomycetota bacterium]
MRAEIDPRQPAGRRASRRRGFTLVEIVVALTLLATVLTLSYQILTNILETERVVARLSTPEKIGQGILSMLRRDLLGTVYRNQGERVFQVFDNGMGNRARDELQYLTTVSPILLETLSGQLERGGTDAATSEGYASTTAVYWVLRDTPNARASGAMTLFRQESVNFHGVDPFSSGGLNYEVYDKVVGFSVECFDGFEWFPTWDSQTRLNLEAEELAAQAESTGAAGSNLNRASAPVTSGQAPADPAAMSAPEEEEDQVLPPAAVPVAVRISITILAGDEKGAYTDASGTGAFKEFTYSTIIPVLTALRIPLTRDEEDQGAGGLNDAEGDLSSQGGEPANPPGGGTGGSGKSTSRKTTSPGRTSTASGTRK